MALKDDCQTGNLACRVKGSICRRSPHSMTQTGWITSHAESGFTAPENTTQRISEVRVKKAGITKAKNSLGRSSRHPARYKSSPRFD
jgi:hypothetical protein